MFLKLFLKSIWNFKKNHFIISEKKYRICSRYIFCILICFSLTIRILIRLSFSISILKLTLIFGFSDQNYLKDHSIYCWNNHLKINFFIVFLLLCSFWAFFKQSDIFKFYSALNKLISTVNNCKLLTGS